MANRVLHWRGWPFVGLLLVAFAIWYQGYSNSRANWQSSVTNCQKVQRPASLDAAGRDQDVADFAKRAARARRAEGNFNVAKDYSDIAKRSEERADRARERASIPCQDRYEKPGLTPP